MKFFKNWFYLEGGGAGHVIFGEGDPSHLAIPYDNILKKRKITHNYNAAVRSIEANLEKYGLKLEVDSANLPVILSATIRPHFGTFRQFRSPNNRGKEVNLCVFTASQCHQLRSHGWVETIVEFILEYKLTLTQSAILSFRVHFLSPFSYQTIKSHLDLYSFFQFLQYSVDDGNFIAISGITVSVIDAIVWGYCIY